MISGFFIDYYTNMKGTLSKIFKIIWKTIALFFITSIISVIVFKWIRVPITPLMLIRNVEQLANGKSLKLKHHWISIDDISPKLQLAVVCSEDQNYLKHYGFDMGAIQKALKENEKGKRIRGGSTISQQTAKNVFLWHGRSYLRKGLEAYFTLLIELVWSKERIMEVYLNSIEMGDGVYGAEAASNYWFHKSANELTKEEASAIAAILPNPLKYKASPANAYITKRKAWVQQQMSFWGNKLNYDIEPEDDSQKTKKKGLK